MSTSVIRNDRLTKFESSIENIEMIDDSDKENSNNEPSTKKSSTCRNSSEKNVTAIQAQQQQSLNKSRNSSVNESLIESNDQNIIHRVVFTGGPCAGKTTAINRAKNFFENIGWKVFCVPETATLLLSTGIFFYELENHTISFQENLLKTLLQIEDTINETVKFYVNKHKKNCLVLYDRGAMDPIAYLNSEDWEELKQKNPLWNEIDLRDNRYDQIIHMITAANGAESFYTLDNNATRTEGLEVAREIDKRCAKTWIGHPYMDVVDNQSDFNLKVTRVIKCICDRVGVEYKDFNLNTKKRKFLVRSMPKDDSLFANYQDFNVVHNYLASNSPKMEARIRKRGQSNVWSYTYTVRTKKGNQNIETRTQIDRREYLILHKTADPTHLPIYKLRRCFQWNHHYFQLDMYEEPCNPSCRGLIILSAYLPADEEIELSQSSSSILPEFLDIEKEITDDPNYSMYNLSKKKQ